MSLTLINPDLKSLTLTAGAIISMNAHFDCNFNTASGKKACLPEWSMSRLDKTTPDQAFSTGYNFYDVHVDPTDEKSRTITKRYGIKFEFGVSGRAGTFSIVNTMIAVGSGVALLGVASAVTDYILSHHWHGKDQYNKIKNAELDEDLLDSVMARRGSYDPLGGVSSPYDGKNMPGA